MKKIRLEFTGGKSSKFWQVAITGSKQTVTYGRIGTDGTSKTKAFESKADAIEASERLIQKKLKKGYLEVSPTSKIKTKKKATSTKKASAKRASKKAANAGTSIAKSLDRIKQWMADNHPLLEKSFNKPATKTAVDKVQREIGIQFPPDVVEYFLTCNGVNFVAPTDHVDLFPGCGRPLRIEQVTKRWQFMCKMANEKEDDWMWIPKGSMQEVAFDPKWIPLSQDHVSIAVDMNPGPKGKVGQVITFKYSWDRCRRFVITDSLTEYFEKLSANLEQGNLTFYCEEGEDLDEVSQMSFDKVDYVTLEHALPQFHSVQTSTKKKK